MRFLPLASTALLIGTWAVARPQTVQSQRISFEITPGVIEARQGDTLVLDHSMPERPAIFSVFGKDYLAHEDELVVGIDISQIPGDYRLCSSLDCDTVIRVRPSGLPSQRFVRPPDPSCRSMRNDSHRETCLVRQKEEEKKRAWEVYRINAAYIGAQLSPLFSKGRTWREPLETMIETEPFGITRLFSRTRTSKPYRASIHRGVDLRASMGTPVRAIQRGKVALVAEDFMYEGNMITLDHGQGFFSLYLHLSRFAPDVRFGAIVEAGSIIGYSGATGQGITGPHLHLIVKIRGANVDPVQFLRKRVQSDN